MENNKKNLTYYSIVRYDAIEMIPSNVKSILEIGCGGGNTLIEIKKRFPHIKVTGLDIVSKESQKKLDKFILQDINEEHSLFEDNSFDVILFLDVLEHLYDPARVLKHNLKFLKKGGYAISSIPNFRNRALLLNYIRGDFKYEDSGLFDSTHIRFFFKKNMYDLYENCGLSIDGEKKSYNYGNKFQKLINQASFKLFDDLFVLQYLLLGVK